MLKNIDAVHPTPEEIGQGWVYSVGRRGPNGHGRFVTENYGNKETGENVHVKIHRHRHAADAIEWFTSGTSKYTSPPYAGLGNEARVEPRGSQRRPWVTIYFRRNNVTVNLRSKAGKDHEAAMNIARIIDKKIEANLE